MKHLTLKILFILTASIGMTTLLVDQSIGGEEGIVSSKRDASPNQAGLLADAISGANNASQITNGENEVGAAAAYLLETNELLYGFRDQKQWPIASITKLMTALVVRKSMTPEEIVAIDEDAIAAPGEAGDFKTGERFTSKDLVKAMLVTSSNDASKALARHYGDAEFVTEMNKLASEIGMNNTVFTDSTGLSARNLSTPDDLNKLIKYIWLNDPEVLTITRLTTTSIADIDNSRSRKLININLFAGRSNFLGGKTGQIPDSEGNLISVFRLPDKSSPVVIVVLGADDRFKETEKILTQL
ncbi:MAG: D-alanyl-D-alanine carboxypeptidase [Candidatus Colwellbacteria bacterium]|nr:D-alanyl-D-alanine carboxypeptidase [Candidatus Colwellbacteria bacterium]MBI3088925.1 D-alanyl-D-alanine carboxypeptidase [Candidatus Colwellbacteria bacterium]